MPQGWTLRSAVVAGRDLVDLPFEVGGLDISGFTIRFTDRRAELHGTADLEHTDFLEQAAQAAVRVRVGEGAKVRQDLRVGQ